MAYASWSVVFGEQPSASKWNILGTNDASFNDGTGIAASAITPEKLLSGNGTTWVWQSWTPTWTNLTVGSATQSFKYARIGKGVWFRGYLTFGAGTAMGTNPKFSLPVTALDVHKGSATGAVSIGQAYYEDNGSASYQGVTVLETTTTGILYVQNTSSTYLNVNQMTSTVPFTWASGDELRINGFYEAA